MPTQSAHANDNAKRILGAIGGAIVLDRLMNGNKQSGSANSSSSSRNASSAVSQASRMQTYLNDLGFDAGPVDGQPGARTRAAISAYQASRGFSATGTLTPNEFVALQADHARAKNPNAGAAPVKAEVYAAQKYLTEAGYNPGGADGVWGRNSQTALDQFRAAQGIAGSGPLTRTDLDALSMVVHGVAPGKNGTGIAAVQGAPEASPLSLPAPAASEYVHVGNFPLAGSDLFFEDLANRMIKAQPFLMEEPGFRESLFNRRVLSGDYPQYERLRQDAIRGNNLEKADARTAFYAQMPGVIAGVEPVTPDNPIAVALYDRVFFDKYEEGNGLRMRGQLFERSIETSHVRNDLKIVTDTRGSDILPATREEAKVWIDRLSAFTKNRKEVVQVYWGRITNIGENRELESFAAQQKNRDLTTAATFVLDRVTLHSVSTGERIDPEPLYEWRLTGGDQMVASAQSGLESARHFGLVIKDGHVFPSEMSKSGATIAVETPKGTRAGLAAYQRGWTLLRIAALARIAQEPEWAEQENIFIGLAQAFFDDAQYTAFFGNNVSRSVPPPRGFIDVHNYKNWDTFFPDEFALRAAKKRFFEEYYPAIVAQAPVWPMPVLHYTRIGLGEYDFDREVFPLNYEYNGLTTGPHQLRVASLFQHAFSADWIGGLPNEIAMSEARATEMIRRLNETGRREIYLAWKADLDLNEDGSQLEAASRKRKPSGTPYLRPGRGYLKEIGFYTDPEFTDPILMLDPQSVLTKIEPLAKPDLGSVLQSVELVSGQALFMRAYDEIGTQEHAERLINMFDNVTKATEFTVADERAKAVAQLAEMPRAEDEFWVEGQYTLGAYDLETGEFTVAQMNNLKYSHGMTIPAHLDISFVRIPGQDGISVDRPTAELIVNQNRRQIGFRTRVKVFKFEDKTEAYRVHFHAALKPLETAFFRLNPDNDSQEVFAREGAETENVFERQFVVDDFEGLADSPMLFDHHTRDLLLVAYGGELISDERFKGMRQIAARAIAAGRVDPGPEFFDKIPMTSSKVVLDASFESFKSWMRAKANAIGNRVVFRHRSSRIEPCGFADMISGTAINNPALQGNIDVRAEVDAMMEPIFSGETRRVYLPRSFITRMGKVDPSSGRCRGTDEQDLVVLTGATIEAGELRTYSREFRELETTVGSTKAISGDNGQISLRIVAQVKETRFLSGDPNRGQTEVVASFSGTNPEGVEIYTGGPEIKTASFEAPVAAVPAAAATPKGANAPGAGDVTIVDGALSNDIRSEYDVLGIRAGMSFAEAEALIDAEMEIAMTMATKSDRFQPGPMNFVRAYVTAGSDQAIALFGPTADGPVVAISRKLARTGKPWPLDRVVEGMSKKYGIPNQVAPNNETAHWSSRNRGNARKCPQLSIVNPDSRMLDLGFVSGEEFATPEGYELVMSLPGISSVDETKFQIGDQCGTYIQFGTKGVNAHPVGSQFYTFLFAPRIADALPKPEEEEEEIEIKF